MNQFDGARLDIDRMSDLEVGWDSYVAKPPSREARLIGYCIIDMLERSSKQCVIRCVIPTSDNSIVIAYYDPYDPYDHYVWEISYDGEIGLQLQNYESGEVTWVDLQVEEISKYIK